MPAKKKASSAKNKTSSTDGARGPSVNNARQGKRTTSYKDHVSEWFADGIRDGMFPKSMVDRHLRGEVTYDEVMKLWVAKHL